MRSLPNKNKYGIAFFSHLRLLPPVEMHILKCESLNILKYFPSHFIELLFESEATIIKKEVNYLNALLLQNQNRLPMGRIFGLLMVKWLLYHPGSFSVVVLFFIFQEHPQERKQKTEEFVKFSPYILSDLNLPTPQWYNCSITPCSRLVIPSCSSVPWFWLWSCLNSGQRQSEHWPLPHFQLVWNVTQEAIYEFASHKI